MRGLDNLGRRASMLEHWAEDAPAEALTVADEREREAAAALACADGCLGELLRVEPRLIERQPLADIGVELDAGFRAVHAYVTARARGDRGQMLGAARALHRAAALALAVCEEAGLPARAP